VVVGDDAGDADAGANQVVAHDGLEAGLTGFEVAASDESAMLLCKLNDSGVESVLGGAIQVSHAFLDRSNAVKDGGGQGLVSLDAGVEVVLSLNLRQQEHLSVGSPQDNHLIIAFL